MSKESGLWYSGSPPEQAYLLSQFRRCKIQNTGIKSATQRLKSGDLSLLRVPQCLRQACKINTTCTSCKIKIAMLLNQNRHVVKFHLLKYLDRITRAQARGKRVDDFRRSLLWGFITQPWPSQSGGTTHGVDNLLTVFFYWNAQMLVNNSTENLLTPCQENYKQTKEPQKPVLKQDMNTHDKQTHLDIQLHAYINHCNLCVKVCSLTIDRTALQSKPNQQCKLLQLASEMGYMKTEVISKGAIFFLPLSLVPKALLKQSFICWLHKWLNKSAKSI